MRGLNGWKVLNPSSELPTEVVDTIKEHNGFHWPCNWFYDESFLRGNDFIVVTDDGGYYKVHAQFMVWYRIGERFGSQAIWTNAALKRTLKSLMTEGQTTYDPNYQT